ncbi:MAG: hypothetical protein ACOCUU_02135 [Nanoarchaeota archaeon]
MNNKAQSNVVNVMAGLILLAGGFSLIFNYVNLGLLLAGLGALIEAIKIVMQTGLK